MADWIISNSSLEVLTEVLDIVLVIFEVFMYDYQNESLCHLIGARRGLLRPDTQKVLKQTFPSYSFLGDNLKTN